MTNKQNLPSTQPSAESAAPSMCGACGHDAVHDSDGPKDLNGFVHADKCPCCNCLSGWGTGGASEMSKWPYQDIRRSPRFGDCDKPAPISAGGRIGEPIYPAPDHPSPTAPPEPSPSPSPAEAIKKGVHDWTHPADGCEEPNCNHITPRTCEQAEKTIKFYRYLLGRMRERLYKADPDAARQDWERLMAALEEPND
jgi:hypothetical protein